MELSDTVLYCTIYRRFFGSDSRRQTRGRLLHATWLSVILGFQGLSRLFEVSDQQRHQVTEEASILRGCWEPRAFISPTRHSTRQSIFFSWSVVAALLQPPNWGANFRRKRHIEPNESIDVTAFFVCEMIRAADDCSLPRQLEMGMTK